MKNKIIIFTASMGSGHLTAAEGIKNQYNSDEYEVLIIDVLGLNFFGKLCQKTFFFLGEFFPKILDSIFWASANPFPLFFEKAYYKAWFPIGYLRKKFEGNNVKKVWICFPGLTPAIEKFWQKEIHVQLTDHQSPYFPWAWGKNVVVHVLDTETQENFQKVFPKKNIQLDSFPLPKKFFEAQNFSPLQKDEILKKHLLPCDKKIFLFFFHHVLLGNEQELLEKFLKNPAFQKHFGVIFAGKNVASFEKFSSENRLLILSKTPDIHEYYAVADAVCGKCGGALVSEIMFFDLPFCISGIFSGQEEGNAEYLKKYYSKKLFSL